MEQDEKEERERERDDRRRGTAGGRVNVLDRRRTWVTAGVEAAVERWNESKRRERSGLQASTLQAGLRVCSASEEQSDLPFSNHARCLGPSTINRQDKYTSHGGGWTGIICAFSDEAALHFGKSETMTDTSFGFSMLRDAIPLFHVVFQRKAATPAQENIRILVETF